MDSPGVTHLLSTLLPHHNGKQLEQKFGAENGNDYFVPNTDSVIFDMERKEIFEWFLIKKILRRLEPYGGFSILNRIVII